MRIKKFFIFLILLFTISVSGFARNTIIADAKLEQIIEISNRDYYARCIIAVEIERDDDFKYRDYCFDFFADWYNNQTYLGNIEIKGGSFRRVSDYQYAHRYAFYEKSRTIRFKIDCTFRWSPYANTETLIFHLGLMRDINNKYDMENATQVDIRVRNPFLGVDKNKELNITVEKNMNLGKTFAGGTLSTKPGGTGTPAEIIIESEEGNNFKVHMPKKVTIKNTQRNEQTLDVNLGFRNASKDGRYSPSNHRDGYALTRFIIDGVCRTKSNEYGKYEGSFIVRVEYTDER